MIFSFFAKTSNMVKWCYVMIPYNGTIFHVWDCYSLPRGMSGTVQDVILQSVRNFTLSCKRMKIPCMSMYIFQSHTKQVLSAP